MPSTNYGMSVEELERKLNAAQSDQNKRFKSFLEPISAVLRRSFIHKRHPRQTYNITEVSGDAVRHVTGTLEATLVMAEELPDVDREMLHIELTHHSLEHFVAYMRHLDHNYRGLVERHLKLREYTEQLQRKVNGESEAAKTYPADRATTYDPHAQDEIRREHDLLEGRVHQERPELSPWRLPLAEAPDPAHQHAFTQAAPSHQHTFGLAANVVPNLIGKPPSKP